MIDRTMLSDRGLRDEVRQWWRAGGLGGGKKLVWQSRDNTIPPLHKLDPPFRHRKSHRRPYLLVFVVHWHPRAGSKYSADLGYTLTAL